MNGKMVIKYGLVSIENYEQKKKAEQQQSKVLGQKPVKRKTD